MNKLQETLEDLSRACGLHKVFKMNNGYTLAVCAIMEKGEVFSAHFYTYDEEGVEVNINTTHNLFTPGDIRFMMNEVASTYLAAAIHHEHKVFKLQASCPKRLRIYKRVLNTLGMEFSLLETGLYEGCPFEVYELTSEPIAEEVEDLPFWRYYGGGYDCPTIEMSHSMVLDIEKAYGVHWQGYGDLLGFRDNSLIFTECVKTFREEELFVIGNRITIPKKAWVREFPTWF